MHLFRVGDHSFFLELHSLGKHSIMHDTNTVADDLTLFPLLPPLLNPVENELGLRKNRFRFEWGFLFIYMYFNLQRNGLFLSLKHSHTLYNTNLPFHKCFNRVVQGPVQVGGECCTKCYTKKEMLMPESLWAENTSYWGKGFLDMSGEVGTIQNDVLSSEKPVYESQPLCYGFLWGIKEKCVSKPILPTERKQNL